MDYAICGDRTQTELRVTLTDVRIQRILKRIRIISLPIALRGVGWLGDIDNVCVGRVSLILRKRSDSGGEQKSETKDLHTAELLKRWLERNGFTMPQLSSASPSASKSPNDRLVERPVRSMLRPKSLHPFGFSF